MKTIEEEWKDYTAAIWNSPVSNTQYIETKKAFYAGVSMTLGHLNQVADDESMTDDQGGAHMEDMARECMKFCVDLLKKHVEGN